MTEISLVDKFTVEARNQTNGALNQYLFTLTTEVSIVDGDKLYITFPPQIKIPLIENLNIASSQRIVNQVVVTDEIQAVINGQTVIITFVKVGAISGTYMLTMDNIRNPTSLQPSD